ncbi:MAG: tripartite tricarboxylate transporter substrate-binding protein, partial [Phreatobacter sp.]
SLPDVPTMQEAGLSGFEAVTWFALAAPAGTPPSIVERLSMEVRRALAKAEVVTRLAAIGAIPAGGSPEDLARFIAAERSKWSAVITAAAVSLQ